MLIEEKALSEDLEEMMTKYSRINNVKGVERYKS